MSKITILLAICLALSSLAACQPTTAAPSAVPPSPSTSRPIDLPTATNVPAEPSPSHTPAPPTATAAPAVETPPTSEPISPAAVEIRQAVDAPLSKSGPWLLINAGQELWALNADGSGLTRLATHDPYLRLTAVSHRGGRAAFITASDPQGYHDLTLHLITLPGGEIQTITPLTSAAVEVGPDTLPGDPAYDLFQVVGQSQWSPDGGSLAFIGAQDGPSADLYLYAADDDGVTRLTDGPSQGYRPHWSPDGKNILHMGAGSFGTGAGYNMDGVWAARADGSGVKKLYSPSSGDELVAGWRDNDTVILYSWSPICEWYNLRALNLESGAVDPLWDGCFTAAAYAPEHDAALILVDEFTAGANPGGQAGIFLAKPGVPAQLLSDAIMFQADWSPDADLFFAAGGDELLAFSPGGESVDTPATMHAIPFIPPGGQTWAWTGPKSTDLTIALPDQEPRQIFSGTIFKPGWSPDGGALLFYGAGTLYAAQAPAFDLVEIPQELDLDSSSPMLWLEQ